jgi:endonuclease YncB( thermonuclease family)
VTFSWAVRSWLSGIDCPEKGQAYGTRAKQAASDLAFGKQVTVQTHGTDKYGRTGADVIPLDFN